MGIHNSDRDFVEAALEGRADAILVSSLTGHAKLLVGELRDKCREAGLNNILLYLGGHLVMDETKWEDAEKIFMDMGFNRVFPPFVLPGAAIAALEADIDTKGV